MISFNDLYDDPICPRCGNELYLINDSIHEFQYNKESKRWNENNEDVTNEYLECDKCMFQVEH